MTTISNHRPVALDAPADLLGELRGRTRDLHTRAERHPIQAALVRGGASREGYASCLCQLRHIHAALEAELAARAGDPVLAPVEPGQFRARKADEDLAALGIDSLELPVEPVVRFAAGRAGLSSLRLLGMQYVLEGSTNGGKFIARAVGRGAGLPAGVATAYLDPYGEAQGERWGSFCRAMASMALDEAGIEEVVAGAEEMFRLIIETFDAMPAEAAPPAGAPGRGRA